MVPKEFPQLNQNAIIEQISFNTLRKKDDLDLLLNLIVGLAGTFAAIFAATAFLLWPVTRVAGTVTSTISAFVPDGST